MSASDDSAARVAALPPEAPSSVVLVVSGPIARRDVAELCDRVRELLEAGRADLVVCGVGALLEPDAVTVDALARLALTARRLGRRVLLQDGCEELRGLLELTGLSALVAPGAGSGLQTEGQTEGREDAPDVEEESDPGDRPSGHVEDV